MTGLELLTLGAWESFYLIGCVGWAMWVFLGPVAEKD